VDHRARHRHGVDRARQASAEWRHGRLPNGKFPDECLSLEWFRSRAEAKVIIEAWRRHCNEVRPHSSLDYLTPHEFVARGARPALPVEDKCSQH
jgi:transposase InsO family protein